jgi:hypothetical protein
MDKRPYALDPAVLPIDETFKVIVDDSGLTEPQQIAISDLVAPLEARVDAADADIITGMGTDVGTGLFTPDDTSNYLTTKEFAAAALQANLYNALILLDSKLKLTQNIGSLYYSTTLTSSQILNLKATKISVLPTPGAGYFNHVKRIFYKLNFVTTPYTLPGAGAFVLKYDTGARSLGNIVSTNLSTAVTIAATSCNYADDNELLTNEAVYLTSSFGGELTLGDGTLDIIVEYETIADFTVIVTPPTSPNCLQPYAATFTNASLTVLGNLIITHNLSTHDLMSLVITDNNGAQVVVTSKLGNEAGANTLNQITVPIGLGIVGTWSFAIIMNIC